MTKSEKKCPQCHSVGFHKMSCTEPYKARKAPVATHVAPLYSNSPPEASKVTLEGFKLSKVPTDEEITRAIEEK